MKFNYPVELQRIRELENYEYPEEETIAVRCYRKDIEILLSYISELSSKLSIDLISNQELVILNKLRDNLNDFIKDNVVVLTGAE